MLSIYSLKASQIFTVKYSKKSCRIDRARSKVKLDIPEIR